jgi:hypothetical protein
VEALKPAKLVLLPNDSHALTETMARVLERDELGNSLAPKFFAAVLHPTWQQAASQFVSAAS